jgi:hypothetical protein
MLGAAQGVDRGPTKTGPKMLKQPDPRNQLDTHGFRQGVRLARDVSVELNRPSHADKWLRTNMVLNAYCVD